MDGERSPNNQDNGDGNPIETLSNMPSFYEHMTGNNTKEHTAYDSSAENEQSPRNTMDEYRELRFDGKLPEEVRDYQDYQEFLEEQEARAAELRQRKSEIFESIDGIMDSRDRDLAIGMLGLLNPEKNRCSDDVFKKFDIFGGIVDRIKGGERESVLDFLNDLGSNAFKNKDFETSRTTYDYSTRIETCGIDFSNKIDKERDERGDVGIRLDYHDSVFYLSSFHSHDERIDRKCLAARVWAKDIVNSAKDEETPFEIERNKYYLGELREIVQFNDAMIRKTDLHKHIDDLAKDVERAIDNTKDDPLNVTLNLRDSKILDVIWSNEVEKTLSDRFEKYDDYKQFLERGKKIKRK